MAITHKYTLIADDVRQENTGKFIVVGLYTGPLGVPSIPTQMALTFMHFLEADRPGNMSVKLRVEHLETGRRVVEGHGQIGVPRPGTVVAPLKVPVQIDAVGAYNFILDIDGEREPIITPFSVMIVRPNMMPGMIPGMMPMR
jgi:hypothetical protein